MTDILFAQRSNVYQPNTSHPEQNSSTTKGGAPKETSFENSYAPRQAPTTGLKHCEI